jgi:hypothetical protein
MRHWIFSCKKITGMISESMDRKLPFYQRMGIRFHLMMCALCRRYEQQLLFIRSVLRRNGETDDRDCQSLPADARERIEKKLTDEIKQES